TWPELKNYRNNEEIFQSVIDKEKLDENGLNGFILLIHIGTDPRRTDKFYNRFNELMNDLQKKGYEFTSLKEIM
ncbi:MAG: polysaccharide deacetylase, partial [Segetibacter sp.]|nr:polysaccharide deacetylase [Segetibacter sp.]